MARFDTSGLDDMVREMQRLGQDIGPVAESMVDAAVEEIKNAWKDSAERHKHRDTGALIDSIGYPQPIYKIGDALARDVYPQGRDGHNVRNAEKAFILNYGTSRIPASHWVDEADEVAGPLVEEKLLEIWDEYLTNAARK